MYQESCRLGKLARLGPVSRKQNGKIHPVCTTLNTIIGRRGKPTFSPTFACPACRLLVGFLGRQAGRFLKGLVMVEHHIGSDVQSQTTSARIPECINLAKRFGDRYRIRREESYRADHGDGARANDLWMNIIPCRYGHIFPHGGNLLAASVDGHPNVAGVLRRMKCCRVHQDGDFGELTVLFDVADFAKVARIMRPRRRRQPSALELERLRAMGFRKGSQPHVKVEPTGRLYVPTGEDGLEYQTPEAAVESKWLPRL